VAGQRCAKAADLPGIRPGVAHAAGDSSRHRARTGDKGTRAAVVITAGLTRDNGLRQAMLDAAKPTLFDLPNTVG
jgi:acetyltransferase